MTGLDYSEVGARIARAIEQDSAAIPILPRVLTELLTLIEDPDSSASELSRLIHQDQVLTAFVLRVASSPQYRGSAPIVSLQQAIARIGLRELSTAAVAKCVGAGVFRADGHAELMRALFRRSLASGLFAKEVARLGRKNVESAFLCGLLYDVGAPFVVQLGLSEVRRLRLDSRGLDLPRLIEDHGRTAGLALARRWGLPAPVTTAMAFAADYERAPSHRYEAQVTCLAVRLGAFVLADPADETALREHEVFADLNLYPQDVEALLQKRDSVLASVELLGS